MNLSDSKQLSDFLIQEFSYMLNYKTSSINLVNRNIIYSGDLLLILTATLDELLKKEKKPLRPFSFGNGVESNNIFIMPVIKVGINGFGRIGRLSFRGIWDRCVCFRVCVCARVRACVSASQMRICMCITHTNTCMCTNARACARAHTHTQHANFH